jgi:transcription elongation factor Elf1
MSNTTENEYSRIDIVMYCPHCGTENRFRIPDGSNIYGIIFCVACGKQI